MDAVLEQQEEVQAPASDAGVGAGETVNGDGGGQAGTPTP